MRKALKAAGWFGGAMVAVIVGAALPLPTLAASVVMWPVVLVCMYQGTKQISEIMG